MSHFKKNIALSVISTENLKVSSIFDKILILSIICDNCRSKDEKTFKEERSIEIGLFDNIYEWAPNKYITTLKHMAEENISQEFRLKNTWIN